MGEKKEKEGDETEGGKAREVRAGGGAWRVGRGRG